MAKATPEAVGMSAARLERINPVMQSYVDRGVYAGVQTIVARRGIVVHEGQYGWRDKEAGGGLFLLTDPAVQQMTALHTNQAALGGGSLFSAATAAVTVDTNTAAIVGASGTAVGNVIGAAAKSAVK